MNIAKTLGKEVTISKNAENTLLIAVFAALSFAGALVKFYTPLSPVPFTLQTFFLYLSVFYLGSRSAGMAQAIYIIAGLVGAPVFAAGITGAIALVGPTAGYLAGFIAAAFIMSAVLRTVKTRNFAVIAAVFAAGAVIVLASGALHLALVYKMPLETAVTSGFMVFVPAEMIKIAAAAAFLRGKELKN